MELLGVVPEPASLASILAIGGLLSFRRRRMALNMFQTGDSPENSSSRHQPVTEFFFYVARRVCGHQARDGRSDPSRPRLCRAAQAGRR